MADSFGARSTLEVSGREYEIHRLDALQSKFDVARLPYSLKVLLENVLRLEDGESVTTDDIEAIATWDAKAEPSKEIPFQPARVLMQDFTGVPAVVDLAAMRDAMEELGSDAAKINPLVPVDLVIDHSVQVDAFGNERAFEINAEREFERNQERYEFLRWGQKAFDNFRVVPPATGICHQVNLEYLGRVVYSEEEDGIARAYPDTLVGTDSHTTMINGLSVLGWGVGGIEAEAAMLGQPISMLLPQVIGFRLEGELPDAATRDRPRPARHRDACARRASSASSSSSTVPACPASGSPTGRRSATCLPSSARPARSARPTRRHCVTSSSPDGRPRRSSSLTPTRVSRACSTRPTARSRRSPTRSISTSATSCRRLPVRSDPRTGSRFPIPRARSSRC